MKTSESFVFPVRCNSTVVDLVSYESGLGI